MYSYRIHSQDQLVYPYRTLIVRTDTVWYPTRRHTAAVLYSPEHLAMTAAVLYSPEQLAMTAAVLHPIPHSIRLLAFCLHIHSKYLEHPQFRIISLQMSRTVAK